MPAKLSLSPAQDDAATRAATPGPCPAGFGSWASARGSSAGLTMVELLVAMGAGLFLVGGILQVMVSSKASYRLGEAEARVQENGRFAVQVLAADLRGARSAGCRSMVLDESQDTLNVVACDLLDPTSGETDCTGNPAVGPGTPLGYASSQRGTTDWLARLPGSTSMGAQYKVARQWLRGDVLVSWGVTGQGIFLRSPGSLGDERKGAVDLVLPLGPGHDYYCNIHKGRLALVTDCEATDIFAISNAKIEDCTSSLSAAKLGEVTRLQHDTTCEAGCPDDSSGTSVNMSDTLSRSYNRVGTAYSPGATLSARVFPFAYGVYYVCCMDSRSGEIQEGGPVNNCNTNPSRYRPALCRWSTSTSPRVQQLVPDVADMRVTYDGYTGLSGGQRFLDSPGGVIDAAWVSAQGYWDRVDSARIHLLATAAEEVRTAASVPNPDAPAVANLGYGLASDRRIYHAYDVTAAIRSSSAWYLRP